MILLELEIEDYKQFYGKHLFAPTPNGVVGIIGANGAGKTTLFEAIEWCLYQPSSIRSAELPPRDAQDKRPRVRIRFTNPHSGATYEVERSLKKTGAYAEIRQIDEAGVNIIATGSTTVSSYTATRLIGLEHKAFVATFFTRQKELSFFGELKPTERRREVGRLLGLETIRNAQELIAEERTAKRNVHQGLLAQYNQESGERDFDAERASRNEELAVVDQQLGETATALILATSATGSAESARARLVEEREANLKLQNELATQRAALSAAENAIKSASDEITLLDKLEIERPALVLCAEQSAELEKKVTTLESDRDRYLRRQSLLEQQLQAQHDVTTNTASALAAIATVRTRPEAMRESDGLGEIDDFLAATADVRSADSQLRLESLQRLETEQVAVAGIESELCKFEELLSEIEEKQANLLATGNPDEQEQAAIERRDEAVRTRASFEASIESNNKVLVDYHRFSTQEHVHVDGAICPTCGREIGPDDASQIREHAHSRILEVEREIERIRNEVAHQKQRIVEIDAEMDAIRVRIRDLTNFSTRIKDGQSKIAEKKSALEQARTAVANRMAELDRTVPVSEREIIEQRELVAREREIEQLRAKLGQVRETVLGQIKRAASLGDQIAEVGDVSFDASALSRARTMLDESRAAQTRLVSIDQQLSRRPEHASVITEATVKLERATAEVTRLDTEIAAHPIDELALDRAGMEVDRARQKEQQVRTQQESHRRERLKIEQGLSLIEADQKRLKGVADRAEKARVEADDLDRMYKEFNAFEQYVARRVRPQLEDMTSELVQVITENKYESISLDDDYGVKVWDGELGPYPIEHFSGGERDVIALSARLALSRLIGSQAANPPSFLVLDEVFGSLDQDRRANVLALLSTLAGSAESFQQLFVISHVDDVRLSPAFNEVWRVAELEDGSSRLENLNVTQGVEDL